MPIGPWGTNVTNLVIKIRMIGTAMLNEETMHARVGDVKGHSQEVAPGMVMSVWR